MTSTVPIKKLVHLTLKYETDTGDIITFDSDIEEGSGEITIFAEESGGLWADTRQRITLNALVAKGVPDVSLDLGPKHTIIEKLRFLTQGRADYDHLGDRDFHSATPVEQWIRTEVKTADHLLKILTSDDPSLAYGWLPSWRWDEWNYLFSTGTPAK